MSDESVWIRKTTLKSGKTSYHLRYICPQERRWKSRCVGTDSKVAILEAAKLKDSLGSGTYRATKKIGWTEFVERHAATKAGDSNRYITKSTLLEFGNMLNPQSPRRVTRQMVKTYVAKLRERGNASASINKKIRYIKNAILEGIEDGYLIKNPIGKRWTWEPEQEVLPREITDAEEAALLSKAEELYGFKMWAFIVVALNTGGRCGELLRLTWDNIDTIDDAEVRFIYTKGGKYRRIPINPDVAEILQRLKVQTLKDGGPFRYWDYRQVRHYFERSAAKAGVQDVCIHDMRRTYVTRLIRQGVELTVVQKLVGHASIQTTLKYYNAVHKDADLRAAVSKLRRYNGAG